MTKLDETVLEFVVFIINKLILDTKKQPIEVYTALRDSGILEDYIIKFYKPLHTLGLDTNHSKT